ncbi:dTDP-4-dehydrorhamnose reductase [Pseudomonas sp. L-22-4S-12]|uniref:dTDP-4-dehydrorhamnose reductase n=1 Tax=Pseudomonas sp. L-22-4S-12 TaxID=2610893 RepID=UPI0013231AC8|nr:dTDP-4-dehydrorhamnose reductase [Pseudomonas sp. L-22-4S-12]MWV15964.1 dTDP-4-dehydrorhamnose reductase [Pseudomonas sp. L-22-4S-12]
MKILLLGANGQVGWELQRALAPLGQLVICDRRSADLENPQALDELVVREQPAVIVNAAAYTAVDKAESDAVRARKVNAESVAVLATTAHRLGVWLVHYSTDYVFDGDKPAAYVEDDPTAPLNVYGQTKLDGEQAIRASGCRHLILRTSWVYAVRGGNFAKTILRLAVDRAELRVVADQVGVPTSAELIADVTALLLQRIAFDAALARVASGTYHLVASGATSWHGYAQFVIAEAVRLGMPLRATPESVHPITSAKYPVPARRPVNSRLDNQKLQQTFGLQLPAWEFHVKRMLIELNDWD